ncbi:hypothetical protein PF003_g18803 [Phytophthora fragariae]|nr:hypothetical protein PF003_g18803 [Phytophthora fragariae]
MVLKKFRKDKSGAHRDSTIPTVRLQDGREDHLIEAILDHQIDEQGNETSKCKWVGRTDDITPAHPATNNVNKLATAWWGLPQSPPPDPTTSEHDEAEINGPVDARENGREENNRPLDAGEIGRVRLVLENLEALEQTLHTLIRDQTSLTEAVAAFATRTERRQNQNMEQIKANQALLHEMINQIQSFAVRSDQEVASPSGANDDDIDVYVLNVISWYAAYGLYLGQDQVDWRVGELMLNHAKGKAKKWLLRDYKGERRWSHIVKKMKQRFVTRSSEEDLVASIFIATKETAR